MINFLGGVIVGILLSLVAIITGKRYEAKINEPFRNTKKAEIIRKNTIDDIL